MRAKYYAWRAENVVDLTKFPKARYGTPESDERNKAVREAYARLIDVDPNDREAFDFLVAYVKDVYAFNGVPLRVENPEDM